MFRKPNEPFTWEPIFDETQVLGYYVKDGTGYRRFDTLAERTEWLRTGKPREFYSVGLFLKAGAEPLCWEKTGSESSYEEH